MSYSEIHPYTVFWGMQYPGCYTERAHIQPQFRLTVAALLACYRKV